MGIGSAGSCTNRGGADANRYSTAYGCNAHATNARTTNTGMTNTRMTNTGTTATTCKCVS
jgi:hypothetical protein